MIRVVFFLIFCNCSMTLTGQKAKLGRQTSSIQKVEIEYDGRIVKAYQVLF